MILGVWIVIFLFLGFPSSWDRVFALISGLLIVIIAYRLKSETSTRSLGNMPYVEHKSDTINNNL